MTAPSVPAVDERVQSLVEQARLVLRNCRRQARRPFILELAGTPKAGKTTVLGILKDFLKAQGFRVWIMRERAADCPIAMKGHFFFNAWTSATMLAQVLAQLDTDNDVLLLDRGFFDALVWLELQDKRGQLSAIEKSTFEAFILLERWSRLTDLTVLLRTDPDTAMRRENQGRLIPREGSIMNDDFLRVYNGVLDEVKERHAQVFRVSTVDSDLGERPLQSGIKLLEAILPRLDAWSDPQIAALPRDVVARGFGRATSLSAQELSDFLDSAREQLVFLRRSALEESADYVQLVASAAFTHNGRYLLIQRSPTDKKTTQFGSHTLWQRCHVEHFDDSMSLLDAAGAQLTSRIQDDLHLSRLGDAKAAGGLWSSKDNERNHLGLAFLVDIVDQETAESLSMKEFRRGKRAPELKTHYCTRNELSGIGDLESWSRSAVDSLLPGE